jgi:NhaP-type Na+/H+ or K+/H+ antiporter
MAKRFLPLAVVALLSGMLAACTSPTAPTSASPSAHRVNVPMQSAGTLVGSDT